MAKEGKAVVGSKVSVDGEEGVISEISKDGKLITVAFQYKAKEVLLVGGDDAASEESEDEDSDVSEDSDASESESESESEASESEDEDSDESESESEESDS